MIRLRIKHHFRLSLIILKKSGLRTFISRELYTLRSLIFNCLDFYIYTIDLDKNAKKAQIPADTECKLLDRHSDIAKLEKEGYDFGLFLAKDDFRLKQGAALLCFFRNKTITYIAWIATDQKAKDSLTNIPFPVSFEQGAYLGRMQRSSGLKSKGDSAVFIFSQALRVLSRAGNKYCSFIVLTNNRIPQLILAKQLGILPSAAARYIRFFCWHHWQEKPLNKLPDALLKYK
jgi:hypothetical protein